MNKEIFNPERTVGSLIELFCFSFYKTPGKWHTSPTLKNSSINDPEKNGPDFFILSYLMACGEANT